MNKSPQYNQQTEPKQCKSKFAETCLYQNMPVAITASISENKYKIMGSILKRISSKNS